MKIERGIFCLRLGAQMPGSREAREAAQEESISSITSFDT